MTFRAEADAALDPLASDLVRVPRDHQLADLLSVGLTQLADSASALSNRSQARAVVSLFVTAIGRYDLT